MYTWLPNKIEEAKHIILAGRNTRPDFKFKSSASHAEIERCEKELGYALPNSYKEFLKFSNGANIFCNIGPVFEFDTAASWYGDSGIIIQGTSSIIQFNQEQDRIYLEDNDEKSTLLFVI
ncbi:MAG: SMI1/KNR4 family protein [Acaryochloris sp. RU_4_1]|nr:SMI1/KNR4 family protein [Acaryochloris sp. RU_4_1]